MNNDLERVVIKVTDEDSFHTLLRKLANDGYVTNGIVFTSTPQLIYINDKYDLEYGDLDWFLENELLNYTYAKLEDILEDKIK